MTQRSTDVPYKNRRGGGRHQQQQQWDVGNWNGETLIYSRSTKDDEQSSNSDNNNILNTSNVPPGGNQSYLIFFQQKLPCIYQFQFSSIQWSIFFVRSIKHE